MPAPAPRSPPSAAPHILWPYWNPQSPIAPDDRDVGRSKRRVRTAVAPDDVPHVTNDATRYHDAHLATVIRDDILPDIVRVAALADVPITWVLRLKRRDDAIQVGEIAARSVDLAGVGGVVSLHGWERVGESHRGHPPAPT